MRRAVFLERQYDQDSVISFRVVMWFPVPPERRHMYLNPRFVSALYGDLKPSPDELSLLRTGAVREKVVSINVEKYSEANNRVRTTAELLAEIRRTAEVQYLAELNRQSGAEITASLYGTTYDDAIPGGWKLVVDTS